MTYETNGSGYIPTPDEVNSAFQEVQDHNQKHTGLGAGMANIFKAMIEAQDSDVEDETPTEDIYAAVHKKLGDSTAEGDMSGELVEILHEDVFMRIGLKLAPLGSTLQTTGGNRATSTGLEPIIENTELFTDYLATLHPEDVQDGKMPILGAAVSQLSTTINTCFNPEAREELPENMQAMATQIGEEALRTFIAIGPEYQRLGLDSNSLRTRHNQKPEGEGYLWLSKDATPEQIAQKTAHDTYNQAHRDAHLFETMENYVTYWGRNLLPEFIIADNRQYLDAPDRQGFGPARWHYDGGQPYWRDALTFVNQLAQNARTAAFVEEVRAGLLQSLDTAIAETTNVADERYKYLAESHDDLVNVRKAIAGEDYEEERFIEYTKKLEW